MTLVGAFGVFLMVSYSESQGVWSRDQRALHINVRELYAIFICLTVFYGNMTGVHLKFELDNTTWLCDAVARDLGFGFGVFQGTYRLVPFIFQAAPMSQLTDCPGSIIQTISGS